MFCLLKATNSYQYQVGPKQVCCRFTKAKLIVWKKKKQPWISFHANTQIEKFHSNAFQHLIYLLDEFDVIKILVHVNLSTNSKKLKTNCMQRSPYFFYVFLHTLLITRKKWCIPKRNSIYTTYIFNIHGFIYVCTLYISKYSFRGEQGLTPFYFIKHMYA